MRRGLTDTTNKQAAAIHSSDENTEDLIALGDEDKYLKLTSPTASPDKKKSRKSGMYITHNYFETRYMLLVILQLYSEITQSNHLKYLPAYDYIVHCSLLIIEPQI